MLIFEELTNEIIGSAIEVHKELGPGLLESAYQACMCHELNLRKIPFRQQIDLPVKYKGIHLDCGYRIDMLVEEKVVVEFKAVTEMIPIYEAQLLTYLKLSRCKVGLLINFHVSVLKDGIKRKVL
ncbi:MAG: GxxExxY protein [Planctomycetes bacterium]|nr:GxxExxY protein [Planctomycetota bacterium]